MTYPTNPYKRQLSEVASDNPPAQNLLVAGNTNDGTEIACVAQRLRLSSTGAPSSPTPTASSSSSRLISSTLESGSSITTSRAVWGSIGRGREIGKLVDRACSQPMDPAAFLQSLRDNNFDIMHPYTFIDVIKRFNEKNLIDHFNELVVYLILNCQIYARHSELIIRNIQTWSDERIIDLFIGFSNERNIGTEALANTSYENPNLIVPFFFLPEGIHLVRALIDNLIENKRYQLLKDLVFCTDDSSSRYIENPLTTISSLLVLEHLCLSTDREVQKLMTTPVKVRGYESMEVRELKDVLVEVREFTEMVKYLQKNKGKEDLIGYIVSSFENKGENGNPLLLYNVIPLLNKLIEIPDAYIPHKNTEKPMHVIEYFFRMDVYPGFGFLHDADSFETLLPVVAQLVEKKKWNILEAIFKRGVKNRQLPLAMPQVAQTALPIFEKLVNEKQFDTIRKILSYSDEQSQETALFSNFTEWMPLLILLADNNEFQIVEELLCQQNIKGATLLHATNGSLFEKTGPLLCKFIENDQFDAVIHMLSMETYAGVLAFTTTSLTDFRLIEPCIALLIEKQQFNIIRLLFTVHNNTFDSIAHSQACFPIVLRILERLLEANQFDVIEIILSKQNTSFRTPLNNPIIYDLAQPFLTKLNALGQGQLVQRLWLKAENRTRDCKYATRCSKK